MDIRLALVEDEKARQEFSSREWPAVDATHFHPNDVVFDKKRYTFFAEDHGALIGYVIIEIDMGVCYIDSIITAQVYRGRGVGKRLLQAAEEKGRVEHCHKMFLVTGADWEARAFYTRQGYTTVGILEQHYNRQDFVQMQKMLIH